MTFRVIWRRRRKEGREEGRKVEVEVEVEVEVDWLHKFDFSSLCVFKCQLKRFASKEAQSHLLHLFDFSVHRLVFTFTCNFSMFFLQLKIFIKG